MKARPTLSSSLSAAGAVAGAGSGAEVAADGKNDSRGVRFSLGVVLSFEAGTAGGSVSEVRPCEVDGRVSPSVNLLISGGLTSSGLDSSSRKLGSCDTSKDGCGTRPLLAPSVDSIGASKLVEGALNVTVDCAGFTPKAGDMGKSSSASKSPVSAGEEPRKLDALKDFGGDTVLRRGDCLLARTGTASLASIGSSFP
jgi:hypothetical protein